MSTTFHLPRFQSYLVNSTALVCAAVGGIVLVGWHSGDDTLIRLVPSWHPMAYNIALGIVAVGAGVVFLLRQLRVPTVLCAVVAVGAAILTFVEYWWNVVLRVDRFLTDFQVIKSPELPVIAEAESAACLLMVGTALALLAVKKRSKYTPALTLLAAMTVWAVSSIFFTANLSGVTWFRDGGRLAPMAPHTAAAFIGLSGILLALSLGESAAWRDRVWRWAPLLAGVGITVVAVGLWQVMIVERDARIGEHLDLEAARARTAVTQRFDKAVQAVTRISSLPFRERATLAVQRGRATMMMERNPGMALLTWLDPEFKVIRRVSLDNDEASGALKLSQRQRVALAAALPRMVPTITPGPTSSPSDDLLELVVPVSIEGEEKGFLISTLFADRFIESAISSEPGLGDVSLVVSRGQSPLFRREPDEPEAAALRERWRREISFSVHGAQMRVEVWPTATWMASRENSVPEVSLGIGLLGALFLAMILLLADKSRRRARAAETAHQEIAKLMLGREQSARELEEKNRQLAAALTAAREATAVKSRFLAMMSHEIRTPLNGVIGMNQLLRSTRLDGDQALCVETIRESAESLLGILNDILDFSKLEAGRLELQRVPFDLEATLRSVVNSLRPIAGEKGLTLDSQVEPDVPHWVHGDPLRLRQVLVNLIGNAIKFTEQGTVALRVERANAGSQLRYAVEDTGEGIAPDQLGSIFHEFTQADNTSTRSHGGTGLGLAITKQLVELMGGEIGCDSQLGRGSTFWFRLPLSPASGSVTKAHLAVSDAGQTEHQPAAHLRVLLVDDNAINRLVAHQLLRKEGCSVDAVGSGREAIEAFRGTEFDLIFMDIHMPDLDGFEVTAEVRRLEDGRHHTPIVAITARAMSGDRDECLAAGMDDYLSKPIDAKELRDILARWTLGHKSPVSVSSEPGSTSYPADKAV